MCSLSLRLYGTGQDRPDQLLGSGAKGEVKRGVQEMAWAQGPGETPGKLGQDRHTKRKRTNKSKQVDEERVKGMLEQKRHKATLLLAPQGATS